MVKSSAKSHMGTAVVLALDIGSSSVRANLFTAGARRLRSYETQLTYKAAHAEGGAEIDAQELIDLLFSAIDKTLAKAGENAAGIRGVGMCSFVSNLVGVDHAGKAVTPLYTWADTRPTSEADELKSRLDEMEVLERTGCYLHASYLPARLLWLQKTMLDSFEKTRRWLSVGDLIWLRLFGKAEQSLSVASWSGLLNRHTLDWDDEMLRLSGIGRDKLPDLVDVDEGRSGLAKEYASRWPALRAATWFPCVGDGVVSNLGSLCIGPDEVAVQVGTSGGMRAFVPGVVESIPWGLWSYRMDKHVGLLGGALSEGGNLLSWLTGLLQVKDRDKLMKEAASLQPDSHGLTVLPFIAGERSPGWRGDAHAALVGMTLDTDRAEIARAFQEAIAYRFALIFERLHAALPPTKLIVASGGALLGVEGWVQMLADVLGEPVTASDEEEASSRGTAMLVLRSLGVIHDFAEVTTKQGKEYSPDMRRHEIYMRGRARQEDLYRRLLS